MANEKRLISYDVLIAHLDSCIEQGKGLFKSVCVAIKCFVEQMPTVDAVEVVHGRWNRKQIGKYTGADEVVCSCCGYFIAVVCSDTGFNEAIKGMNYCPNCGAKMDGD